MCHYEVVYPVQSIKSSYNARIKIIIIRFILISLKQNPHKK